jgi:flagellar protein FlaJ
MYALSVGGLNQLEILEAMARADDAYGEVAREFRSIVRETAYFDVDYRTAIRTRSLRTPSDELATFLTDMLSILDSGGDVTEFLDDETETQMRTATQRQQLRLETLELFGEMYMTLSLFPLLLIIVLVVMSMLGEADRTLMWATVYGLLPTIGAAFLVLVATVTTDDPGGGSLDGGDSRHDGGLLSGGETGVATGHAVAARIRNRERIHLVASFLRRPHLVFREHPLYTLAVTVPIAAAAVGWAIATGLAPRSFVALTRRPLRGTALYVYLPLYVTLIPIAVFHEWNARIRDALVGDLSDGLRKLASANDTGLTLLDSIRTVAETSTGPLAREFDAIHAKVQYGTRLDDALVEFANGYRVPRLARTVKLVSKAQETSSQIASVLATAARASEARDDLERERRSRTRMQVVIVIVTYLTLLAVMAILKSQFLDVMAGMTDQSSGGSGAPGGFGGNVDTAVLNTLFFHAVTLQAIISGTIAGYIRNADLRSGLKFVVVLQTVALVTWTVVG